MIEIKNLCKAYGEKKLFDDYCLTINNGDFVVFMGASGCGKTTMLNMLGGLEKPDKGDILVDERSICGIEKKNHFFATKVGFLFQNFALIENATVRKNLELVHKKTRTEYSVEQALRMVGLDGYEDQHIYKLSGGEQQRVALARLVLKKCDIILADEPTGSLDNDNAMKVMNILEKLNSMGKTIVLVTHNDKLISKNRKVIQL